ncbi:MAG TPA: metallophosphoesterase family protein [Vicinamibacterales bacterium]|nr:metallophosphoesterase family protein [Vicinamibacterales bacterium]
MRYLVLSDIHANLEALDAVLEAARPRDAVLVLGDLVGYGADPNAVIDRIRELAPMTIVRGNHDKVGAGIDRVDSFNPLARQAIAWTAATLTPANRAWLAALPQGPAIIDELVEICHGAPFDEDVYIFDDLDARRAIRASARPLCLFGHTHVPAIFRFEAQLEAIGPPRGARFELVIDRAGKYLVNCGSVGQPRDGDARAACGLLDTDARAISILRIPYNVGAAQAKILAAGLPEILAQRLAVGR